MPKQTSPKRLRALVDLSLRRSKDPTSPLYTEWYGWPEGEVFEPPEHMDVGQALARGVVEVVSGSAAL